jgi:hypothetical protein
MKYSDRQAELATRDAQERALHLAVRRTWLVVIFYFLLPLPLSILFFTTIHIIQGS